MKKSLRATSIIEAIIVLLIVVIGITGVYGLLSSSQKLVDSTSKRIQAIQIARDGIESFTNIRDTNWILYAADYKNCWNTLNYNSSCIGTAGTSSDIPAGSYSISQNINNRFELTSVSQSGGYADSDYRSAFAVNKDPRGFFTQQGVINYGVGNTPFYTRELEITYPDGNSDTDRMQVKSIVGWNDSSRATPQRLEMDVILTNWKSKE